MAIVAHADESLMNERQAAAFDAFVESKMSRL
jgi:hypothetical protein